jgi:DNA polymerase III subunit beta
MQFTVSQPEFVQALHSVSRSCGSRELPVLSNILISAKENSLQLSATNLEIGVIKTIPAEVSEEGEVTIPAKTLVDVVSNLSVKEIEIKGSVEQIQITAEGFSAQMNGIPASEFPAIPLSGSNKVVVDAALLAKSLPEVSFAAAVDEGRPVLTGILTEIKNKQFQLVATDGYRLAHKTMPVDEIAQFRALIPRKTFDEVCRLLSEDDADEVTISTSENQNQMIFQFGSTIVSSRLIEGQFPGWEKIIPAAYKARIDVNKSDLLKAVKLSAVFARGEANVVKLANADGKLVLSSEAK